jgi:hypothetical protein
MLRVLQALAAPAPAVMLIEDAHWADPETLAVLEYLGDNFAGQQNATVHVGQHHTGQNPGR